MIFVAVGTSANGFDELVIAADRAAAAIGVPGLAQIGDGRFLSQTLRWRRFLPDDEFRRLLAAAEVVVCHGGMGILGEAMRVRRPIVAMPRRGATRAGNPTNDQRALLRRLAESQPITVCEEPSELEGALRRAVARRGEPVDYRLDTDIPQRLVAFLSSSVAAR